MSAEMLLSLFLLLGALDPHFVTEVQGGVGGWTGGMAQELGVGPSWQVRAGVALFRWLEIDANYTGSYNPSLQRAGTGLLSSGGFLDLRLIAPLGHVEPFAYAGVGASYGSIVGDPAGTSLRAAGNPILPLGAGIEFELDTHWRVGLEGTLQLNLGQGSNSKNPDHANAHTWNLVASLSYEI